MELKAINETKLNTLTLFFCLLKMTIYLQLCVLFCFKIIFNFIKQARPGQFKMLGQHFFLSAGSC
jgi:hypothetical protein